MPEKKVKYWEIIADRLSKSGWSWGCVSVVNAEGRGIFVVDAHRDDGKRYVVRSDEKLTAFLETEKVTRSTIRQRDPHVQRHRLKHERAAYAFSPGSAHKR
jgi:hypothetical protein